MRFIARRFAGGGENQITRYLDFGSRNLRSAEWGATNQSVYRIRSCRWGGRLHGGGSVLRKASCVVPWRKMMAQSVPLVENAKESRRFSIRCNGLTARGANRSFRQLDHPEMGFSQSGRCTSLELTLYCQMQSSDPQDDQEMTHECQFLVSSVTMVFQCCWHHLIASHLLGRSQFAAACGLNGSIREVRGGRR